MERLIVKAVRLAMSRLQDHAVLVGLANVDEFTFRSFLLAEIRRSSPGSRCQTEWHKHDLLVQADGVNALIEIKFYLFRRTIDLDGNPGRWKGGAGPKNEDEFRKCIDKLHASTLRGIHRKYLVLVYERGNPKGGRCSYDLSYGALRPDERLKLVKTIVHKMSDVVCKLAEIT